MYIGRNIHREPSRTSKEGKAKNTWRSGLKTELKKIGKTWQKQKQHLKSVRNGKTL